MGYVLAAFVACVSVVVIAVAPAWREPAAAVLVASVGGACYVFIVRRPRVLAVAFVVSFFLAPFLLLFGVVPIIAFGAPLVWHLADFLFGSGKRERERVAQASLAGAARRLDDRAESFDTFRM